MKKYILFVFATHKDQDLFVRMLSDQILELLGENEIKYYYGDENIVITFDTTLEITDVKQLMTLILSHQKIVHFLFPVDKENIQYYLSPELYEHLFGNTPLNRSGTAFRKDTSKEDDSNTSDQNLKDYDDFLLENNFDGDGLLMFEPVFEEKTPTLDELLDKINDKGISSLSDTEQNLLKQYSK